MSNRDAGGAGTVRGWIEGGGGYLGVLATRPVSGARLMPPLELLGRYGYVQGGVAMVGCFPENRDFYALTVAVLDPGVRPELEARFIIPSFDVARAELQLEMDDHRDVPGLVSRPPSVVRYFVRVRRDVLWDFAEGQGYLDMRAAEDELVWRICSQMNRHFYAGEGRLSALVLSCGRDMTVLKGDGPTEAVMRFYRLDRVEAYGWLIARQMAIPGLIGAAPPHSVPDEAIAWEGYLSNPETISGTLAQRGYRLVVGAGGELAALLLDMYRRVHGYSLDLALECVAPMPDSEVGRLPDDRRDEFEALHYIHRDGVLDGAWTMAALSRVGDGTYRLIGLADPNGCKAPVYAVVADADMQVAMVSSTAPALEAALESFGSGLPLTPAARWRGQGGNHEHGSAFVFTFVGGERRLEARDGLGHGLSWPAVVRAEDESDVFSPPMPDEEIGVVLSDGDVDELSRRTFAESSSWSASQLREWLDRLVTVTVSNPAWRLTLVQALTRWFDLYFPVSPGMLPSPRSLIAEALGRLFEGVPLAAVATPDDPDRRVTWAELNEQGIPVPTPDGALYLDARDFPFGGPQSAAQVVAMAAEVGWSRVMVFGCRGERYLGVGLPSGAGVRLDLYGWTGDYLGAGLVDAEIYVHGHAADHVGRGMSGGRLVIYGDVGDDLMCDATGGIVYVMGDAGLRVLGGAQGSAKAVILGAALDHAGERLRAVDGFLCINGMRFSPDGRLGRAVSPFTGRALMAGAVSGVCYLNDPLGSVSGQQMPDVWGEDFTEDDEDLLWPYIVRCGALFGFDVDELLMVSGERRPPRGVYRRLSPFPVGC